MSVFVAFCLFFCAISVSGNGDNMIGPGLWNVINIKSCPEKAQYEFKCEVEMRKINRTHSGFNSKITMDTTFDDSFGVRIDICKYVDGGCKQYQVLSDENFVNFVDKYAKENVKQCLAMAEIDPPAFPVEPGEYAVNNYVFDYSELPSDCVYGRFHAEAYILKGNLEIGCVELEIEFKETPEDDDDYEEEE